jgi:UDP-N-acetylglucosamine transferase subunit ALG13
MIFVTGGTLGHDQLMVEIDFLIDSKIINQLVIAHIGKGKYVPKKCKSFRFANDLSKYRKKANLVIGHGGIASIVESLIDSKKYIGVANTAPEFPGRHQEETLERFSDENYIIWCKQLSLLGECISEAHNKKFKRYKSSRWSVKERITKFIEEEKILEKPKILVLLSGGGHTYQMSNLVNLMEERYSYLYLILENDFISEKFIKVKGKKLQIPRAYSIKNDLIRNIISTIHSSSAILKLIIKSKPDFVISCGGGGGIAQICFSWAKILGLNKIYLEDPCRTKSKSISGDFVYRFNLFDLFLVGWPSSTKFYPKSEYSGQLL